MDHLRRCDLPDLAATEALGRSIAGLLRAGDAILLDGPLGAGKTALARALLRAACDAPAMEVPSPSYTLVQTYDGRSAAGAPLSIAHFDLWRLQGPSALEELGWSEARDGVVLVEWPDRLGSLAPADALQVSLQPLPVLAGGGAEAGAGSGARALDAPRRATLTGWPGRPGLPA